MNRLKPCKTCVSDKSDHSFHSQQGPQSEKVRNSCYRTLGQIGKGRAKGTLGTAWVLLGPIIP